MGRFGWTVSSKRTNGEFLILRGEMSSLSFPRPKLHESMIHIRPLPSIPVSGTIYWKAERTANCTRPICGWVEGVRVQLKDDKSQKAW